MYIADLTKYCKILFRKNILSNRKTKALVLNSFAAFTSHPNNPFVSTNPNGSSVMCTDGTN